ncbi:MAG: MdtA/MuxA family multidrug efflux RND transporter periplasmic adaptor subunit [Casimicrobiaceae bacterium]
MTSSVTPAPVRSSASHAALAAETASAPPPASPPPASPRRRRWPLVVLLLALVSAAAVGAYFFWYKPAASTSAAPATPAPTGGRFDMQGRPMPVIAAPAKKGSIDVYVNALGTVTPRNLVTVKPRVDGQLMRVAFTEGQMIKAGELLAEIDPRPFQVQLTQANGQMAKDQALLKNAQLDLERYNTLLTQDSISKQQVDTQQALVRQYEGAVQADQGAVDSAKLQLTYSHVIAPLAGRVGLRQVDPGNVVHASDANGIVVIAQVQPINATFPIPEDNVQRIMKRLASGEPTVVEAWDREQKNKLATGRLITADNQIDTTTGTVKMKAEFGNETLALFPNQFVNVRMLVQTLPDALLIPSAAIQRGAPGTFVYVVKDDQTVTVVPVKLGPIQGEVTSITSGLQPGALVVVDGADKLREGAKVELITAESRVVTPAAGGRRGPRGDKGAGTGGARAPGEGGSGKGRPPVAPAPTAPVPGTPAPTAHPGG